MESTAPDIWKKEILRLKKRIEKLPHQDNLIVFFGSSSIRLWVNMVMDLSPLNVLNLGFGGSSFEWCNYYFDELFQDLQPTQLLLYGGENDLSSGTTSERVLYNFERLFDKARLQYPDAEIGVISLKPSLQRTDLIPRIQEVNRLLHRSILIRPKAYFVEIHQAMLDDSGNARPELYLSDGLHMNKEGYKIWAEIVGSFLRRER